MTKNGMAAKNIVIEGGNPDEITLDESVRISFPLSYDFRFSSESSNGEGIPVSLIEVCDTRTVIKMSGDAQQLKLKMIKPEDRSNVDPTGNAATPTGDESGDRLGDNVVKYVDWLMKENANMDKKAKEFAQIVQNSRREIII